MKKINVIQFLPYFPPHKGGLENVAQEFGKFYTKNLYWEVTNIIFWVWQRDFGKISKEEKLEISKNENLSCIKNENWKIIWYEKNWYKVYILPAFDIIYNYPVPKFWEEEFWNILKITERYLEEKINEWENTIIQTHTRFFLSTFLGLIFAKINKIKLVHVEHGSWYVKSIAWRKRIISIIYDNSLGRLVLIFADKIVAISKKNKDFTKKFSSKEIKVIYNGINFNFYPKVKSNNWKIRLTFVGRLIKLKWIDILLETIKKLKLENYNYSFILNIVWDWEEKNKLEEFVKNNQLDNNVIFCWLKDKNCIEEEILPNTDILINPSLQEWLPTTVLEWLISKCVVVATDVGGTSEISDKNDLIIVKPWDMEDLEKGLKFAIENIENFSWLSYEDIKKRFDWDESVAEYFNLYKSIINGK